MDNVNALRSIAEMPINLSVEQIGALQAGIKALQEQAERENGEMNTPLQDICIILLVHTIFQ